MREERHVDHGDQRIVEVPHERIPGGKLGDFVARIHHARLWHVVEKEEDSDGQIISEVGRMAAMNDHRGLKQNMTIDGKTKRGKDESGGTPLPSMHKFHVRLHAGKHEVFAQHLGTPIT